ncbi:MAG: hypothetical protein JW751_15955 [Polyangiaceae bacterium]|nr:hypothetical protein [Polyangiaceae bacterium]
MDVPLGTRGGKPWGRPGSCSSCGTPGCRRGARVVGQMVVGPDGEVVREEIRRGRAYCPNPDCPVKSWTVYEPGGYPHRTFTLAVSSSGIAQLAADDGATLEAVAKRHRCDRRTVGRWVNWVVRLYATVELVRACARLDPTGMPPPPAPPRRSPARVRGGWMLLLLDHLSHVLRGRGVALEPGPGLVAILRQQYDRFRTVFHIARDPPPLHVAAVLALV